MLTDGDRALEKPLQIIQPIKCLTLQEIQNIIQENDISKKAPGYVLIIGRILKEMSSKALST
jgi:hypothetical protein